ncbi:MAG: cytochrome c biogenesis protein CcdA [Thermoplasmata archaeon]|nr:MAG: cytochrome c biogenesis protein CcdA [Thermoplasmata archaeon]
MKKGILCILLILTLTLTSTISEGKENVVCMAYFYVHGCDECEKVKPYIESLEENFSFLNVERYAAEENYELFEDIRKAYDALYGVPIVFIGNEWYYLNPEEEDFEEKMKELEASIIEFREMGGVECPIIDGTLNFPKPVCILEFYDFTNENDSFFIQKLEDALKGNVSYTQITTFDVSEKTNKTILRNLFNTTHQEFFSPCIFVGEKAFLANEKYFNNIVREAKNFSKIGLSCPEIPHEGKKICIVFFYTPVCGECRKAKEENIDKLKFYYPLDVKEYNVLIDTKLLFDYYEAFDVSENNRSSFAIFIGDKYFYKNSQFPELEEEVKKYVDTGLKCPETEESSPILPPLLVVLAGGLADGINPCAFATLVFFIAYLERMKHSKKALLSIGISFSLAVFLGYLLIGLGVLAFYYSIEGIGVVSAYIYLFAGIFALLFAALNIFDYFRIEKEEKTILQLPNFLKKRRGRIIKILTEKRGILLLSSLAFVVGFAISLLEFVCTGQILFPIMAVIKSASPETIRAFAYLIAYNIMFIVPLLLILSFFYIGYASEALGEIQKRRHGLVKIFTAIVLLIAGIYMLHVAL